MTSRSGGVGIVSSGDDDLAGGLRRGERGAFADLVARYRADILRLVRRRLGPRSLWTEDVTQDVLLQAQRSAPRFEGRSALRTWLYGVVRNVSRHHLRRERARRGREEDADARLAEIPDGCLDPLQRLEQEERATLVRDAVARLTPEHREALRLRDFEGHDYEAIARMLQIPLGTVRSRLHNARAALGSALLETLRTRS